MNKIANDQIIALKKILNKLKEGTASGEGMEKYYNDIIDAYNDGVLDKLDYLEIMKAASKGSKNE